MTSLQTTGKSGVAMRKPPSNILINHESSSPLYSAARSGVRISTSPDIKSQTVKIDVKSLPNFIDPKLLRQMIAKRTYVHRRILDPVTLHSMGGRKQEPLPQWSTFYNTKREVGSRSSFFIHQRPKSEGRVLARPRTEQLLKKKPVDIAELKQGYQRVVAKVDVSVNPTVTRWVKPDIELSDNVWCSNISSGRVDKQDKEAADQYLEENLSVRDKRNQFFDNNVQKIQQLIDVQKFGQKSWEYDASKLETSIIQNGKSCTRRGMEPYMYSQEFYQRQVHDADGLTAAWRNQFFKQHAKINEDLRKGNVTQPQKDVGPSQMFSITSFSQDFDESNPSHRMLMQQVRMNPGKARPELLARQLAQQNSYHNADILNQGNDATPVPAVKLAPSNNDSGENYSSEEFTGVDQKSASITPTASNAVTMRDDISKKQPTITPEDSAEKTRDDEAHSPTQSNRCERGPAPHSLKKQSDSKNKANSSSVLHQARYLLNRQPATNDGAAQRRYAPPDMVGGSNDTALLDPRQVQAGPFDSSRLVTPQPQLAADVLSFLESQNVTHRVDDQPINTELIKGSGSLERAISSFMMDANASQRTSVQKAEKRKADMKSLKHIYGGSPVRGGGLRLYTNSQFRSHLHKMTSQRSSTAATDAILPLQVAQVASMRNSREHKVGKGRKNSKMSKGQGRNLMGGANSLSGADGNLYRTQNDHIQIQVNDDHLLLSDLQWHQKDRRFNNQAAYHYYATEGTNSRNHSQLGHAGSTNNKQRVNKGESEHFADLAHSRNAEHPNATQKVQELIGQFRNMRDQRMKSIEENRQLGEDNQEIDSMKHSLAGWGAEGSQGFGPHTGMIQTPLGGTSQCFMANRKRIGSRGAARSRPFGITGNDSCRRNQGAKTAEGQKRGVARLHGGGAPTLQAVTSADPGMTQSGSSFIVPASQSRKSSHLGTAASSHHQNALRGRAGAQGLAKDLSNLSGPPQLAEFHR